MARRLQAYRDGELSPALYSATALHIAACPDCSEQVREIDSMETLLSGSRPEPIALSNQDSAQLFARILAEVHPSTPGRREVWMNPRTLGGLAAVAGLIVLGVLGILKAHSPRDIAAKAFPPKHRTLFLATSPGKPKQKLVIGSGPDSRPAKRTRSVVWSGRRLRPLGRPRLAEYTGVRLTPENPAVAPELAIERAVTDLLLEGTPDPEVSDLGGSAVPPKLIVIVQRVQDSGVLANVVQVTVTHDDAESLGYVRTASCNSAVNGMPVWTECKLTDTKSETTTEMDTLTALDRAGLTSFLHVASTCARTDELQRQIP